MIYIFLCDDNEILLSKYADQMNGISRKYEIPILLKTFSSGEELILHQSDDNESEPDILFIDILMGGINGIETVKKLREMGSKAEVIFLTSSEGYKFQSFDVDPLHYFIKDVQDTDKFEAIFLKAVHLVKKKAKDIFVANFAGNTKLIQLKDILYFEASSQGTVINFEGGIFILNEILDALEAELSDKYFVRCHRAYLINIKAIDEILKSSVLLLNGNNIPVGTSYMKAVKLAFSACLSQLF